jgi:RNA polymerase sigma-70 factor (ECF subfamily)
LLLRLRNAQDDDAWQEFVALYAPLIHAYGMRRGLQDADAADVAQQVLQSVSRSMDGFRYDPARGSFRGWLLTVTRNQVFKAFRQGQREVAGSGDTGVQQMLDQQVDPHQDEAIWNDEHRQRVFRWAAEKVHPEFRKSTWDAFWSVAVEGLPVEEVARTLGLSTGAVYIAKSRVTSRMREMIESIGDSGTD